MARASYSDVLVDKSCHEDMMIDKLLLYTTGAVIMTHTEVLRLTLSCMGLLGDGNGKTL